MQDQISNTRLLAAHPRLRVATNAADVAMIASHGSGIRVAQCDRTVAESNADYAQGRSAPGKIVTNAPGEHSWHNYDLAVDVYPFIHGEDGPLDWNPMDAEFLAMDAAMKAQGLAAGRDWHCLKDYPHYQLACLPASPTDADRAAYESGGVAAVWARYA